MQSLSWYARRLRSMSIAEIAWRMHSVARDQVDRPRFALGLVPSAAKAAGQPWPPVLDLCDVATGSWPGDAHRQPWLAALLEEADSVARNRLSFFNLREHHLGDPIDWRRDHSLGVSSPRGFAPAIDYRDVRTAGDCKLVWEPSRCHQFVVLGRAYRASGEQKYAEALAQQFKSWLDANPFGYGMNWRSPLELAIRVINWVWALDLVRDCEAFDEELRHRILHSAHLHMWEIARKYSRASSANNHAIGEAAGVFVGASYFEGFDRSKEWREQARAILEREIQRQTYADGVNKEQAFSYHLFVTHFFLLCGTVARKRNEDFTPRYWQTLGKMLDFVAAINAGGRPPMYGDCDDAKVLDLGSDHTDLSGILACGAALFERADWKAQAAKWPQHAEWLLGASGRQAFDGLAANRVNPTSRAFPDAGIYLLHNGDVSVTFDCGELGFGSIAAHGHADALSVTLRVGGEDVLVDPGTYDYFTHPEWRDYFRSTRAHNTVEVDGCDQSEMLGKFLWGKRAKARCVAWEPDKRRVCGEHDGYTRLPQPVTHRRTVELPAADKLRVRDHLFGEGRHTARMCLHFAEDCEVVQSTESSVSVRLQSGRAVKLAFDSRLEIKLVRGDEQGRFGWVSRGYHQRTASTALVASLVVEGEVEFTTEFSISSAEKQGDAMVESAHLQKRAMHV